MARQNLSLVAKEFSRYAGRDYRGSSQLYEMLSSFVAYDADLLEIASHGQSALPNLFFGAVHYVLKRYKNEPLTRYYPSLYRSAIIDDGLFPLFRSFCKSHRSDLIDIISARIVQTNEVSRCAYLYPAFNLVSKISGNAALAMIDIGASAGLHLLWDQYGYDYGSGRMYCNQTSPVRIKAELKGNNHPSFDEISPLVRSRFGIDLQVVRSDQSDDIEWLDALIWPEHDSRRELFREAIDILKRESHRIVFLEGDAAVILPDVLGKVSLHEIPCVYHTHIWRQLSETSKSQLVETLETFGHNREVFFISALDRLGLELFSPAGHRYWTLANYEQHGRWIEWLFEGN